MIAPSPGVSIDAAIRIQKEIQNRIGDESKKEDGCKKDHDCEQDLSGYRTNEPSETKPLKTISVSAGRTLPVIAFSVARISVPPGL